MGHQTNPPNGDTIPHRSVKMQTSFIDTKYVFPPTCDSVTKNNQPVNGEHQQTN